MGWTVLAGTVNVPVNTQNLQRDAVHAGIRKRDKMYSGSAVFHGGANEMQQTPVDRYQGGAQPPRSFPGTLTLRVKSLP